MRDGKVCGLKKSRAGVCPSPRRVDFRLSERRLLIPRWNHAGRREGQTVCRRGRDLPIHRDSPTCVTGVCRKCPPRFERRFNFETIAPIADEVRELGTRVHTRRQRCCAESTITPVDRSLSNCWSPCSRFAQRRSDEGLASDAASSPLMSHRRAVAGATGDHP